MHSFSFVRISGALAFLFLFLVSFACAAEEFTGRVVHVQDGDTLTVLVSKTQVKVRLSEIDAPESKQPFGARSKQSLSELAFGKVVRVVAIGIDRYGRTLGRVYVATLDVNSEQIRRGMAWVYDQYVKDVSLYAYQKTAKSERRGLWIENSPTPPWEWRRAKKANAFS